MALARVRELEQVLFMEKARVSELEREIDTERHARQQAKEFSDTQQL